MRYLISNLLTLSSHHFSTIKEDEGYDTFDLFLLDILEKADIENYVVELGIDIETNGLDPLQNSIHLITIGNKEFQFCFDLHSIDKARFSCFIKTLNIANVLWINHNIKFDYEFIRYRLNAPLIKIYDTMIVEQRLWLNSKIPKDLYSTFRRYNKTKVIVSDAVDTKDFLKMDKNNYKSLLQVKHVIYACEDVELLFDIKEGQYKFIEKFDYNKIIDIENRLVRVLAETELQGSKIDLELHKKLLINNRRKKFELECELDEKFRKLREIFVPNDFRIRGKIYDKIRQHKQANIDLFGDSYLDDKPDKRYMNWNSSKFVVEILGYLKQECPMKNGNDEFSEANVPLISESGYVYNVTEDTFTTTEKIIEVYLLLNPECPIKDFWELLFNYREIIKNITTYGESFLKKIDLSTGKIHTIYRQCTANNGRLQSGGGKQLSVKFNSQNVKREEEYRQLFIADEGYLYYTGDFSGAELCVMISKSQDNNLRELSLLGDMHSPIVQAGWRNIFAFRGDKDAHAYVVTNKINKEKRQTGKNNTFAFFYGAGAARLGKTINVVKEEGYIYMLTLKKMFGKTVKFLENTVEKAFENGYLIIDERTNARIWFEKVIESKRNKTELSWKEVDEINGEARNMTISGTQANFVKEAMVELFEYFELHEMDCKIIFQIHDELVIQIPEKHKDTYPIIITKIMEDVAQLYLTNVSVKVEWSINKFWKK